MTRKVYRTAMGKTVDMGALMLQNEKVRAIGNMGVNARGDLVDGSDQVIDQRNQQIKRQTERQSQPVKKFATSKKSKSAVAPAQSQIDFSQIDAPSTVANPIQKTK